MKDSSTAKLDVVGPYITPQLATSVTASCINFVIIMILNLMYERVAIWITDMGEALRDYVSKMIAFMFYVSTCVYIVTVLETMEYI